MRFTVFVLWVVGLSSHLWAVDSAPSDWVAQAASTYQAALETPDRNHRVQKFSEAEALFAKAISTVRDSSASQSSSDASAELYVNLGNAALGAEHLGAAILAYRRALVVDPDHGRAKQNVEHARKFIADWVPKPDQEILLGSFFDWTRHLKSSDWFGFAGIAFLIAAVCCAIFLRTENRVLRALAITFGVIWIAALIVGFSQSDSVTPIAVVVVPETTARSADSIHAPARFPEPLPSGTELEIVDDRGEWLRVRMFDGREVWVRASAVELV